MPIVSFYGILKVQSLNLLSSQGHDWLQKELREHDEQQNKIAESGLTLQGLYGVPPAQGSKISVWVHCKKRQQASFLTSKLLCTLI